MKDLPDASIDIVVTSPPYWGQRTSSGFGVEADPREYLSELTRLFVEMIPKLKPEATVWINLGDSYNTPINWKLDDRRYSSLGADGNGLGDENSAYVKPRSKRKAFVEKETPWLTYGNLLGLPYRLVEQLCDSGYLFRGEVIWRKLNAMPEGRCRRPHRQHESIYLLAISERHQFRTKPPVPSVWEFPNERISGLPHYSRFPVQLPLRCIEAHGVQSPETIVFDPFAGSGTTGVAAKQMGCGFVGFEIDEEQCAAANERLRTTGRELRVA
ncbi:MAG: site-specific DNA-methyltransferase [Solirubrobacterales bacterium]|nr:site-specific DNA-methyltransferase [Solirubrobacterales bacterium]